jgi:hypothetical protein
MLMGRSRSGGTTLRGRRCLAVMAVAMVTVTMLLRAGHGGGGEKNRAGQKDGGEGGFHDNVLGLEGIGWAAQ